MKWWRKEKRKKKEKKREKRKGKRKRKVKVLLERSLTSGKGYAQKTACSTHFSGVRRVKLLALLSDTSVVYYQCEDAGLVTFKYTRKCEAVCLVLRVKFAVNLV